MNFIRSPYLSSQVKGKDAINANEFGPSFKKFKKALMNGYNFSIITARGTSKDSLRKGIKVLIDFWARLFDNYYYEQMDRIYRNRAKSENKSLDLLNNWR